CDIATSPASSEAPIMKPPHKDAVGRALSILVKSLNEENGSDYVFQKVPANLVPLQSLPDNVAALRLAKTVMDKELDAIISYMQRRRNTASPIERLPPEILLAILDSLLPSISSAELLHLTTVSTLWYDTMVHSPQLWTVLKSPLSPQIAGLFVKRSGSLPLSLDWNDNDFDVPDQREEMKRVLEIPIQNSSRLKSISASIFESEPTVLQLVESPMPQLETLRVVNLVESSLRRPSKSFRLADGPSLLEFGLDGPYLSSWKSPRLLGLTSLSIVRPGVAPSVEELLHILQCSPQLESLYLSAWNNWSPDVPDTPFASPDIPVHLPRLKSIHISDIEPPHFQGILSLLYAPASQSVHIESWYATEDDTSLEVLFFPGDDQLASLLGLINWSSSSSDEPTPILVKVEWDRFEIKREEGDKELKILIYTSSRIAYQAVDLLGRFFQNQSHDRTEVKLELDCVGYRWMDIELDILPWSRCLVSLSVEGKAGCRAVVDQLGKQSQHPTSDGRTRWTTRWMARSRLGSQLKT
ncbi:hypothetical protein FRB90_002934, partial [Tulasnella sp. 427]